MAVVLEDSIYVYDISNMNLIRRIETSPNPHGKASVVDMGRFINVL